MVARIVTSFLFFGILSCVSSPGINDSSRSTKRAAFDQIAIGDPASKVHEKLGKPFETKEEKYQDKSFQVLDYPDDLGQPGFTFSIDINSRVAGKTHWLNPSSDETNLSKILKSEFKDSTFVRRTPCQTWGDDEVQVDEQRGVLVSSHNGQAVVVSWSNPALTALRIAEFSIKCPVLQGDR